MDGSSEGDGTSSITSKATSHDPDAFKPWVKEKVLGTGGFGTVTLWKNENSGETVALKKCRWGNTGSPASPETLLSPEHKERWQKEVQIMLRLEHPCVVSCFPVPSELEGGPGDLPILCMEYCSGGDLRKASSKLLFLLFVASLSTYARIELGKSYFGSSQLLNRPENCCGLREVVVRSCLKDLTEAVAYLHSQRIIHRDLKPENIVLQENEGQTRYKLIDLGYAKELEYTSVCTSFVGTLQYLAPELFLSKRQRPLSCSSYNVKIALHARAGECSTSTAKPGEQTSLESLRQLLSLIRYSCTVDYWSLGLVVHEIVTGVRPFLPNMSPVEWSVPACRLSSVPTCRLSSGQCQHVACREVSANMSPVEWMKRVRSKKSCHICVYEGRSGDIHFSERMFDENHISKPLKSGSSHSRIIIHVFRSGLEAWLQLMLEWEPARRGQVEGAKPDDKKQVVAFTRMAALLNKKVIHVSCNALKPECQSKDFHFCWIKLGLLLDIHFRLGLLLDFQFRLGLLLDINFRSGLLLDFQFSTCALTPQVAPHFPTLVEEMLRSPRALVEHALQRRMWCHSLYFLYRENKLLSALISAQKIAMLHLLSRHAEVTRCGQRVLNDIAKLQARHHLFMEALNTDLDHYTSQSPQARVSECTNQFPQARVSEYTSQSPQARVSEYTSQSPQARVSECTNQFPQPRVSEYTSQSPQARVSEYTSQSPQARVSEYTSQSPQARVSEYTSQSPQARVSEYTRQFLSTSEKAYGAWRGGGEATLSAVHAAVDKTQRLDAALTALNTKVMELNGSPFSCAKTPTDTLDTIVSSCEELYVSLRRRSRDERSRPHDSTAMCKLLLQALRKRDRLYQDLYTHIEKQWSCLSEVTALAVPLEELLADIARAAQTISSLQQHRQDDIWKIMAIVVS
ncbi:hypothetical protein HAZT_HAZT004723 [Hyalella azteca]|uniref:IkappaB kinase n=1 Tax=Hyalella azteca TaxID=294128 RepID=A0A6A0GS75_HYAAZ|nr:hypothetical protein HAZT_HAZT004723 [Hyalella azteca]